MRWHLVEGAAGCRAAVDHGWTAVVVDALRASATAAMLFEAGARTVYAVREVDEARALQRRLGDALLAGERGGLPPEGFALGNSPRGVEVARGRDVIFTTTTGAGRMVSAWGAHAVYMGGPVNATAVVRAVVREGRDVVVIPAGLADDPTFDAQEDWAGAAFLVAHAEAVLGAPAEVGEGGDAWAHWAERLREEGLSRLFETAPHADKLRRVGLDADIGCCAQVDLTDAVPRAVERIGEGVRMIRDGG